MAMSANVSFERGLRFEFYLNALPGHDIGTVFEIRGLKLFLPQLRILR